MQTGYTISSTAHAALIGWVLFGGMFRSEPEPLEVTEVAVISSAEFAALTAPRPETQSALPEPEAAAPEPEPEIKPEPEIEDVQPDLGDAQDAPVLAKPPEDVTVALPETRDQPAPRPSERVAPEPVETPSDDAKPEADAQSAVQPEKAEPDVVEEPREETAPDEATTEIVTEAETPSGAMASSVRPPARRPEPPSQVAETTPKPDPEPEPEAETDDAVNDALREALATPETDAPAGPPLSAGEKDALRVAVQNCWNVGSLSTDALKTTVVVAVSMTDDGKPVSGSIKMLSSEGGSQASANQAFEAARRAILRCGARGFKLPAEKYAQWKEIEMTFNPERMRIR